MARWKRYAFVFSWQMAAPLGTSATSYMFVVCHARMANRAWANTPQPNIARLLTETDRAKVAAEFGRSVFLVQPRGAMGRMDPRGVVLARPDRLLGRVRLM